MGTFYGNVLVARKCAEVVPLLAGATAQDGRALRGYAIPAGPGHTVLFFPDPDTDAIELAGPLSRLLGTATLSSYVLPHSRLRSSGGTPISDVLDLRVFEDGEERHFYDSYPGYFDEGETDEDGKPVGGDSVRPDPEGADPEALLPFAAAPVDRVVLESVLRRMALDPEEGGRDGRYVFAEDQHYDVMETLGLDGRRLSTGYTGLSRGELPEGLLLEELMVFGGATFGPAGD
ncbi:hypothetical protein [Streptomyces sp. NBC_00140]|uniref:hypothetical protein n=1 Tax=Streptomyces sp. NBC_00140 TaxID=2975664 RepID=UPI00225C075F|nr:hypothetical protein [Streptomyces sp. NBC_00140]MCX5333209.1 hypothetical protein [Streptomyces sp. NBC_00140]